MGGQQLTVDDVTTTSTLEVWRDKLTREDRAKNEWHHRFGESMGLPKPAGFEPAWRPLRTPPTLPPPGHGSQYVEPTQSALRWDAAVGRNNVPLRAASVTSSKHSAVTLPSMRTVSISSSADRRRDLLVERHGELKAQLALVEEMLAQNKPSTMLTNMSGFSAASRVSATSRASAASRASHASGASKASAQSGAAVETSTGLLGPIPELSDMMGPREPATYGAVPLCLDKRDPDYHALSPFKSKATAAMALPGAMLSTSH